MSDLLKPQNEGLAPSKPVAEMGPPVLLSEDRAGPYTSRDISRNGVHIGTVYGGPRRGYWFDAMYKGYVLGPGLVRATEIECVEDLVREYLEAVEDLKDK
jgi:hypothetical protein